MKPSKMKPSIVAFETNRSGVGKKRDQNQHTVVILRCSSVQEAKKVTNAGLEPTISTLGEWRLIH